MSLITNKNVVIADITYLHFITSLQIIILIFIFYVIFSNQRVELDLKNDTIEDYTLILSNIPYTKSLYEIYDVLNVDGIKPIELIPIYKTNEYNKLKKELDNQRDKLRYCIKQNVTITIS